MLKLGRYKAEIDDQSLLDILLSGTYIKVKKDLAFVYRRKIFVVTPSDFYNTHIVKYTIRVPFVNYTIPKYEPTMTHAQNVARLQEIFSIIKRQEICEDVARLRMGITKKSFSASKATRTMLVETEKKVKSVSKKAI